MLQLLSQLIHGRSPDDLSKGEIGTVDTLVYILFDLYVQSEITVKNTIVKLFGDKYIECLKNVNEIVYNSLSRLY